MLSFDKPKKLRTTKEHNDIYSSEAPAAGTYVPNMSGEDCLKWKAKHIKKGDDPRIEIRKSTNSAQMLLVVRNDDTVTFSSNGKAKIVIGDLMEALNEAREILL
jgi:hypothetical protein